MLAGPKRVLGRQKARRDVRCSNPRVAECPRLTSSVMDCQAAYWPSQLMWSRPPYPIFLHRELEIKCEKHDVHTVCTSTVGIFPLVSGRMRLPGTDIGYRASRSKSGFSGRLDGLGGMGCMKQVI